MWHCKACPTTSNNPRVLLLHIQQEHGFGPDSLEYLLLRHYCQLLAGLRPATRDLLELCTVTDTQVPWLPHLSAGAYINILSDNQDHPTVATLVDGITRAVAVGDNPDHACADCGRRCDNPQYYKDYGLPDATCDGCEAAGQAYQRAVHGAHSFIMCLYPHTPPAQLLSAAHLSATASGHKCTCGACGRVVPQAAGVCEGCVYAYESYRDSVEDAFVAHLEWFFGDAFEGGAGVAADATPVAGPADPPSDMAGFFASATKADAIFAKLQRFTGSVNPQEMAPEGPLRGIAVREPEFAEAALICANRCPDGVPPSWCRDALLWARYARHQGVRVLSEWMRDGDPLALGCMDMCV